MKAIVDCNSFYCACEKVFRPDLKNSPVIVLSNNDGCIISRSDEAKALGIKMAAPLFQVRSILNRHKFGVFSSNYNLYGDLSNRVMNTLKMVAGENNVEVYSVDESFIELSHIDLKNLSGFCTNLKNEVENYTGIPVSIGVAPTKVLCKVANHLAKSEKSKTKGVVVLSDEKITFEALKNIPVGEIWGIGQKFSEWLNDQGIFSGWDLRNKNQEWARKYLGGVKGVRLIRELHGEVSIPASKPRTLNKLITCARMFGQAVTELECLQQSVSLYISLAAGKLRKQGYATGTIHVYVVTNDYEGSYEYKPITIGLDAELPFATSQTNELIRYAMPLVKKLFEMGRSFLKAGVILSRLVPGNSIQGNFFRSDTASNDRILMDTIDNINFGLRTEAIKFAGTGMQRDWKMVQLLHSPRYTSRWNELREIK